MAAHWPDAVPLTVLTTPLSAGPGTGQGRWRGSRRTGPAPGCTRCHRSRLARQRWSRCQTLPWSWRPGSSQTAPRSRR